MNAIARHDDPEALIFCDPPYVNEECTEEAYANGMSDTDHIALSECLHQIQGMAMISGYPSELYQRLYADWKMISIKAYTSKTIARLECLWLSPRAQENAVQKTLF